MTIYQALKEKNKLAGKIKVLAARLTSCNRNTKGTKPSYEFGEVLAEYLKTMDSLVETKTKISAASQPVFETIILMGEVKSIAQTLKSLPVGEDEYSRRYGASDVREYDVQVNEKQRDEMVEKYEAQISIMQDKIDQFNATTHI